MAHGAVQAVDGERQREPGVDDGGHFGLAVGVEAYVGLQAGIAGELGVDADAEGGGHFQRVYYVQVVGPGFGEVLPGVGGGVDADEVVLPAGFVRVLVVGLQGLVVVGAFVTEHGAERFDGGRAADEQVPVMVADFVAEMAERGAVDFAHLFAHAFAFGVVAFLQRDGDQAVIVAGEHVGLGGGFGREVEGETVGGVFGAVGEGQAQAKQGVDQAVFGRFQGAPAGEVLRDGDVRDDVVVAAGGAEGGWAVGGDEPVADVVAGVGAEAPRAAGIAPELAVLFEGAHAGGGRVIAEPVVALVAADVFEVEHVAAGRAFEEAHRRSEGGVRGERKRRKQGLLF